MVEWMDHFEPGVEAKLFGGLDFGGGSSALATAVDERRDGRVLGSEGFGDRVAWLDGDEARPEDRVGARGEDLDVA